MVPVLKTIQKWQLAEDGYNSPWKKAIYHYFVLSISPRFLNLLKFLKLNMKIILLSKFNPMMESACLSSKVLKNDSLHKIAIIYHEISRKRPIYHFLHRALEYQSGLRLMVVICLSLTLLFSISLADRPLNMMSFFKLQKSLKNVQSEFRCRKESKI